MKAGEGWSSRGRSRGLGLWVCLLAGCATGHAHLDQTLEGRTSEAAPDRRTTTGYTVACPDVLAVDVSARPDVSGRKTIGADGRIDLGPLGRVRVEGQGVAELARSVAQAADVQADQVRVRVADYRSQRIYLFGQVFGLQRAVPYEGPETVLELLQRVGGVTPGAAADDVSVVRNHILEGKAPEVFHVDLQAVATHRDESTNLRLQPFDQVYVGETHRSSMEKTVPPLFRPFYEMVCGMYRPTTGQPAGGRHGASLP